MAITATFAADFSKWNTEFARVKSDLKTFEVPVRNVQRQLQTMTDSFSGAKVQREAQVAAAAVEKIGGAAKLTASEQRRLTATVDEALDKYKALGQTAPTSLITLRGELTKIADEEKRIKEGAEHLRTLAGNTAGIAGPAEAGALSFGKLTASLFTAQAAYDAVRATGRLVVEFLGDSIESYGRAEAAQKKLTTALQAQGTATPEVIGQFNDLASTFQNTTAYSDDLINEMEALLTQVGSVMPEDMGKALTAATDLAAGLGIDLQQATMLVGKALEGNTGALGRYGIHLDQARVKAEGMDYILGELEKRFGGQAQAQLDTYAGRVQALANAWDNVKESIGKIIVTNPVVELGLRKIQEATTGLGDGAGKMDTRLSSVVASFGRMAEQIPVFGGGIDLVSAKVATDISVLEDWAKSANDAYNIMAKLSRGAPKLEVNAGFNFKPVTAGLDMFWEEQDKAKKAAEAYAETIRRLRDQLSGSALLKDLKDTITAFEGLPKPIQDSKFAEDALVDAYLRALPALENANTAMLTQTERAAGLAISLGRLEPPIESAAKALQGLGQQVSIENFFGGLDSVGFEAALVRPFVKLKTEGGDIPTSVLFPIKEKMSDLAKAATEDFARMGTSISDAFAQMLTGAAGFKEGFLKVWDDLKAGVTRILADLLDTFVNRFLKGLLGALTGTKGAFASAFSGIFGGMFGGGSAGFGAAIAPGSMFAGMPGGGAGLGAGLSGLLGGIGAGGAGLGLGFLGKQLFGGAGAASGAFGGASGAASGALLGSIVPGIGTAIGALIGGLSGLFGGLFGSSKGIKTNDQRDAFFQQWGANQAGGFVGGTGNNSTFMQLAGRLSEITGEAGGGTLFKNLIGASDPKALADAIAAVNAKLAEYKEKTDAAKASEDQQAAAIAATKAQLDEKTTAIRTQMQSLDDELAKLNASEAPEAHMGVVEKQTRDRIAREKADLQRQLDAAQEAAAVAIDAIKAAGTGASDELKAQGEGVIDDLKVGFVSLGDLTRAQFDRIRTMLGDLGKNVPTIHIPYRFTQEGGGLPVGAELPARTGGGSTTRPPGYASGTPGLGFVDFGPEQLVRLHGREAVVPASKAESAAAAWGGTTTSSPSGAAQTVVIMQIDKREIGRAIADVLPGELRRLGVRVRA